jgi:2-keto-4-pentenoate hydratase
MSDADRLAVLLVDAHRHRNRLASGEAPAPAGIDDAYRVQDEVVAALSPGERVTAWKVSPPRGGADPAASPIPPGRCHPSPARLAAAGFHMLGIEVEIAFRLGRGLPPRAASYADQDVLGAVDAALVVIELCDSRFSDWQDAPPLLRLADFQSNGALIVGAAVPAWRSIDFAALAAQLWVNDRLRVESRGAHPVGDPSRLLPWLATHVAARSDGLRRGDIVTTGSWTGMHFVAPGDVVEARFPGFGEARLALAA